MILTNDMNYETYFAREIMHDRNFDSTIILYVINNFKYYEKFKITEK